MSRVKWEQANPGAAAKLQTRSPKVMAAMIGRLFEFGSVDQMKQEDEEEFEQWANDSEQQRLVVLAGAAETSLSADARDYSDGVHKQALPVHHKLGLIPCNDTTEKEHGFEMEEQRRVAWIRSERAAISNRTEFSAVAVSRGSSRVHTALLKHTI